MLGAVLDATWLRVAGVAPLFVAGFAYEICLWWGDRIHWAIVFGLLLSALAAGSLGQLIS